MSHSYPSDISREQFARILTWSRPDAGPSPAPWNDVFCGVLLRSGEAARRTSPIGALASISGNWSERWPRSIPFWSKSRLDKESERGSSFCIVDSQSVEHGHRCTRAMTQARRCRESSVISRWTPIAPDTRDYRRRHRPGRGFGDV